MYAVDRLPVRTLECDMRKPLVPPTSEVWFRAPLCGHLQPFRAQRNQVQLSTDSTGVAFTIVCAKSQCPTRGKVQTVLGTQLVTAPRST